MLNADDVARLQDTATAIRETREVEIEFYREADDETLLSQPVTLCYLGNRPIERDTDRAGQVTITLLVKGAVDLDVQKNDRFVSEGTTYVIDLVRPDRSIETVAEARVLA